MAAEAGHYYIQVGTEIFASENGKMAFTKDRVEYFLDQIVEGLEDMKQNGSAEEQEDARACFLNLRIFPLRIH